MLVEPAKCRLHTRMVCVPWGGMGESPPLALLPNTAGPLQRKAMAALKFRSRGLSRVGYEDNLRTQTLSKGLGRGLMLGALERCWHGTHGLASPSQRICHAWQRVACASARRGATDSFRLAPTFT
jgi:hypothetical protein